MAGDTLKFLDYRKPKLEAGDYTFEVTQTYGDPDGDTITLPKQTVNIKVQGDRIRINPDQVFAKYPPAGEKGNFNDTIPHISLKKPTLPWERSAYNFDKDSLYNKGEKNAEIHEPWFYLMLINEEDISRGDAFAPKKVRVKDLKSEAYVPQVFYNELSEDITFGTIGAEEEVQVVDLKKSFFKALIADRKEDLQYLAHVRQRESEEGDLKRELSVIMGNRFPQSNPVKYPSGMVNQALLVSLEGYLNDDKSDTPEDEETAYISEGDTSGKDLDDLTEESYIRCIILTQWSFTSKMDKINFEERSKALDVGALRLPSKNSSLNHPFIKNLPKRDGGTPFDDELAAGRSAILHQFRQGDRSLSWYRGPCVPTETTHDGTNQLSDYERGLESDGTYTATDADRLLHYHKDRGMFDVSYATAYELGRFLAIRNEEYAKALYRYKKAKSRYVFLQKDDDDRSQDVIDKGITIENLPYSKLNEEDLTEDRKFIENYLEELALLKEVPHWYLIPDPHLLPQRTIRTFQIDFKWIQSLWLGALSLGGRTQVSAKLYKELVPQITPKIPHAGFFLRSDLVWAYPEMVVNAKAIPPNNGKNLDLTQLKSDKGDTYTDYIDGKLSDKPKNCILKRQEELTPEILMVLTDQDLNYLSLALPPEALHYGSDVTENPVANTDLFTTNKLYVAGKRFSVVWAQGTTIVEGIPQITYTLPDGTSPTIDITAESLSINLGVAGKATKVGELKTALLAHPSIQSITSDSGEEERLLDDSYQKTSVAYVIAGHQFTLIPATGQTLNPSNPTISYILGATPTVSIANGILAIDLGIESCASTLQQLKIALEADPKIDSVDIGDTDQAKQLKATDPSTDAYDSTSNVLNIGGISITLTWVEPVALDNHTLKVNYTLQSGAIPIIAIDGSGKLELQLGKSETPTSLRALKSMLEKQVEIQAVHTDGPDTAKLLATRDAYTQSVKELRVAGKKFTLTMVAGKENAINNSPPTVTFNSPKESTPELSLSGGGLIIQLGAIDNPTSIGQLKTALEHMPEITSVEITEDLDTPLLQEGYLKTEKEFVIAGRVFTLQLAEGQEIQLDNVSLNVLYNKPDGANSTVAINSRSLDINLGEKNSPTTVAQLKAQLLEKDEIDVVSVDAADNEALILNAYMQSELHIANKTFTLSYDKDILDDHVPLVRDILTEGSQPKVRVQERKLIIDVGGRQHPTTLAQLKTELEATDGITEVTTLPEGADTDLIHPYKRFTYTKSIKYAGSTVGDSLNISDLVNNQGIVVVSELALGIKQHLKGTQNYTNFASAHLSRFMLEGEPKVEFSAGGTN